MFSIVIPLYNKSAHIERTLHSVFAQTYEDYEIIVVDDGSTDGSAEIVESLSDPRIRLIRQQNAGVSAARNAGIAAAKGEYVALLDADDEWRPTYLATQADLIERYPECSVFAVGYEFHNDRGEVSPTIIRRLPFEGEDGKLTNYFEVASHSHPPICSISITARKSAFEAVGCFPLGIASGEDLLTWARLACRFKIAYSRRVEAIYNLGEGYDFTKRPPRRQDEGDPVGNELKALMISHPDKKMGDYLSHWHKMRASVAIRFGERKETINESIIALKYRKSNFKVLPFIFLALIPKKLRNRIIGLRNKMQ